MNIDKTNWALPEELLHDAAEDGVLHRGEHEAHVVRVRGDSYVGVDLSPDIADN